jgi:peptidoglycan/LPS O-acetylase OafA/YrhL
MRFFQGLLLVVGSLALGTVAGFFAVAFLMDWMDTRREEPSSRGYGELMGGLFCGAPMGTLVALVGSVGWIRAQDEPRPWSPFVWLGVLLGLVAGIVLTYRWNEHGGPGWWVASLVLPACGTVGGILAGLALAVRNAVQVWAAES